MPVDATANGRVIQELREQTSALYFPVSIRPFSQVLDNSDFLGDASWQAVIRDDTSEILAIHKQLYNLVPVRSLMERLEDELLSSGLDLRGMQVADNISHNGARMQRILRLPAHSVEIAPGDSVMLQLKIQNSYDGHSRFGIVFGAYREICSNGLVVGDVMMSVKTKHTSGLDLGEIIEALRVANDRFLDCGAMWQQWRQTPVPEGIAENVFESLPKLTPALHESLLTEYSIQSRRMGTTLWTVYNVLTAWSTHGRADLTQKSDNIASIVREREARVAKVLTHPVFNLAA